MRHVLFAACAAALLAACQSTGSSGGASGAAVPSLGLAMADPAWAPGAGGGAIPRGMQCTLDGGRGATPAISVTGIPDGAAEIVVEFNDKSYGPLSTGGGHGVIAYAHSGGPTATLPSVPGETDRLGVPGARVKQSTRASGRFAAAGYLPPCSGGRGNLYTATVKAVAADGATLAQDVISIGRW